MPFLSIHLVTVLQLDSKTNFCLFGEIYVGQFSAEAFLHDRFRGGRGLLPAFLNAYVTAREKAGNGGSEVMGKQWLKRMAIHWGVHIAFWPTRVEWTDKKGTQKLVGIGFGILQAAVDDDWETLRSSELFRNIGSLIVNTYSR